MRKVIKGQIKKLVRDSMEETMNGLLDAGSKADPGQRSMSAQRRAKASEAAITAAA